MENVITVNFLSTVTSPCLYYMQVIVVLYNIKSQKSVSDDGNRMLVVVIERSFLGCLLKNSVVFIGTI